MRQPPCTGCVASLIALVLSCFVGDPRPPAQQPDVFAQQAAKRRAEELANADIDGDAADEDVADTAPLLDSAPLLSNSAQPQRKALSWRRMLDRQGSLLQGINGWELFKYCVMCVFTVNLKTIFRYVIGWCG